LDLQHRKDREDHTLSSLEINPYAIVFSALQSVAKESNKKALPQQTHYARQPEIKPKKDRLPCETANIFIAIRSE
jgi:hypothetical protein